MEADGTETAAWNSTYQYASSGGFSRYFAAPAYQQAAVAAYFADHDPGLSGMFNRSGRGFPDISALGQRVAVAVAGQLTTAEGTSASAPLVGSLISRVNEERLAAGKAAVGFVNPVLYANPGIFRDVTAGNNSICQVQAFYAVDGWDPVTGLGTPDYPALLETFMALP